MEYTNVITIFIIQYFQQIATRVKSKPDKSIVLPAVVFNRTVVTRVHKSTVNIGFTYIVSKSRFLELKVHASILPLFPAF